MFNSEHCLKCGMCCKTKKPDCEKVTFRVMKFDTDYNKSHVQPVMVESPCGAACNFYDEDDRKCNVYPDRPVVCRWYPFYPIVRGCVVTIGVSTINYCKYGQTIADAYMHDDPEAVKLVEETLKEMKGSLTPKEITQWSQINLMSYRVITELLPKVREL